MSGPMRVAVVRPRRTGAESAVFVTLLVGFTFLTAWFLMLIIGAVTQWHLSYWHTLLTILGLRMVQVGSGWMQWTWPSGKGGQR